MGTLYYGTARTPIRIDDRVLAHLKVLISSKLRRNEPFLLSWTESLDEGSGRISVWLHPSVDLIYRFDGNRTPQIDSALLDELATGSLASNGLHIEATMSRFWTK